MILGYPLGFLTLVFLLSGCTNPARIAEKEAKTFHKMYPNQVKTLNLGKRTLQYAWSGDPRRRLLVFIHGSPGSWHGWSEFLQNPKLQSKFHMVAVDRPGYGGSNAGQSEPSLLKQAQLIQEVLTTNQSGLPVILIGHSYGGPVATQLALIQPVNVAGLILVASSVSPDLEETKWFQIPAQWWPFRSVIPSALRVCNEEILALKGELLRMEPEWEHMRARVAIIHGEADPLVPVQNVDFIQAHVKMNQVTSVDRVPDLNHFIPWKRSDLILKAIFEMNEKLK